MHVALAKPRHFEEKWLSSEFNFGKINLKKKRVRGSLYVTPLYNFSQRASKSIHFLRRISTWNAAQIFWVKSKNKPYRNARNVELIFNLRHKALKWVQYCRGLGIWKILSPMRGEEQHLKNCSVKSLILEKPTPILKNVVLCVWCRSLIWAINVKMFFDLSHKTWKSLHHWRSLSIPKEYSFLENLIKRNPNSNFEKPLRCIVVLHKSYKLMHCTSWKLHNCRNGSDFLSQRKWVRQTDRERQGQKETDRDGRQERRRQFYFHQKSTYFDYSNSNATN